MSEVMKKVLIIAIIFIVFFGVFSIVKNKNIKLDFFSSCLDKGGIYDSNTQKCVIPSANPNDMIKELLPGADVFVPETNLKVSLSNYTSSFKDTSSGLEINGFVFLQKAPYLIEQISTSKSIIFSILNVDYGGTGKFFYLVYFVYEDGGKLEHKDSVFLGDRIVVEEILNQEGKVLLKTKIRKDGEPFVAEPTVSKETLFEIKKTKLIETKDYSSLIRVLSPQKNSQIKSPIKINGQAVGNWYFEGSFPISVVGSNGKILGGGVATANGDWMTTEFVPFSSEVVFDKENATSGAIILKKDNPSGDPKLDDSIEIPVLF